MNRLIKSLFADKSLIERGFSGPVDACGPWAAAHFAQLVIQPWAPTRLIDCDFITAFENFPTSGLKHSGVVLVSVR